MTKIPMLLAVLVALAVPSFAAKKDKKAEAPKPPAELSAGTYTASIKMLACDGCGGEVEKALNGVKGLEAAKVDSKASTVDFTVKAAVKTADIQKTLRAAAEQMGMGADFSLSKIRTLEPKKG
jgi:copper chaperone CopZ